MNISTKTPFGGPLMKAAYLNDYMTSVTKDLQVDYKGRNIRSPRFDPKSSSVLIKVFACALNPFDIELMQGKLKRQYHIKFPFIPGHDISGQVVEVGDECVVLKAGDLVFGSIPAGLGGGMAEFAVLPETLLWKKPETLSFYDAAALGVSAVAAYKIMHEELQIKSGDNILILGAHTAVGSIAVQIAAELGVARMTVEAEPGTHGLMRHLGAGRNGSILPYNLDSMTNLSHFYIHDDIMSDKWWDHLRTDMDAHCVAEKKHGGSAESHHFDAVLDCDCDPENWIRVAPFLRSNAQYIACNTSLAHMKAPVGYNKKNGKGLLESLFECVVCCDEKSQSWRQYHISDLVPAPMVLFQLAKSVRHGHLHPVLDKSEGVYNWETYLEYFERQMSGKFVGKIAFQVQEGGKGAHLKGHIEALKNSRQSRNDTETMSTSRKKKHEPLSFL